MAIQQLENGTYITSELSQFLPNLPILETAIFLQQAGQKDYLELVKEFRDWVRSQIEK